MLLIIIPFLMMSVLQTMDFGERAVQLQDSRSGRWVVMGGEEERRRFWMKVVHLSKVFRTGLVWNREKTGVLGD